MKNLITSMRFNSFYKTQIKRGKLTKQKQLLMTDIIHFKYS